MKTNIISDLSRYNGNYKSKKGRFIRFLWYLTSLLFFQNYIFPFYSLKSFILKIFGAQIGKNVIIKPNVNIKYPWNLVIGNNVWVGEKVWIDNLDLVTINDSVCISQSAYLLTGNHNYKSLYFDLITKPIIIYEGAWIGAKSIICPGVVINPNAIISVGAVLTKDAESSKVYAGNPAILLKDRN